MDTAILSVANLKGLTSIVYTNWFNSIVKQAYFACVNHARTRSLNRSELRNDNKVPCSKVTREPLMAFELKTDR